MLKLNLSKANLAYMFGPTSSFTRLLNVQEVSTHFLHKFGHDFLDILYFSSKVGTNSTHKFNINTLHFLKTFFIRKKIQERNMIAIDWSWTLENFIPWLFYQTVDLNIIPTREVKQKIYICICTHRQQVKNKPNLFKSSISIYANHLIKLP